jgi:bacillithiol biosynthesis cysteine-adding enzyme BshC
MHSETLSFEETGYYASLVLDYLSQKAATKKYYNRFPTLEGFKEQIDEKSASFDHSQRATLVKVLRAQYANIETSVSTEEHIAALAENTTFTITTGHQLNLFTGPLYFLYKIISVVNLAKSLAEQYPNYKFVPVYWMASEDHDFEEISYFNFRGKKLRWNKEASGAVGRLSTEGLQDLFDVFSAELGTSPNAETIKNLFQEAYLRQYNLADATRVLANTLFKEQGLVIIDADDPDLKRAFMPYVKNDLFQNLTFESVTKTNASLEDGGYKVQVNPRKINLFYLQEQLRERLVYDSGGFKVNNTQISFTEESLKQDMEAHPERYSPNVLMRPLYQEVILPNLCYVGGAGELAYWLQLKESFSAQNVSFPMLLLRDSVLVKSEKQAKKQQKLDISNADLFLSKNDFINKYVRRISNISIDFSNQKDQLVTQFEELYTLAEQTDKSFLGAVKAQEVKQIKGLEHLEKRLLKAQKKVLADKIQRSTDLKSDLFPNDGLQERQLNFSELYLEYGEGLIPSLTESLDVLNQEFKILTL